MSQDINALLALANEAAETSVDMNEAVKGGGGSRLLPAGYAFAQLVEYVEMGMHPQEYNGKAKDPAMEVQLGFALTGVAPDPANPGQFLNYANDDGTPYILRPWPFAISRNEKAKAYLLFKALNWKGTAKTFAQLLTQKWCIKIVHEAKSKTDATIVSRMDLKSILPPVESAGPRAGQPYDIPDAPASMYRLFLWDKPTLAGWESLKIEGEYESEENGVKVKKSKNRVQETILSALNFAGSPLEVLLGKGASGLALPSGPAPVTPQQAGPVTPAPVAQVASVPTVAPVVPGAAIATPVVVPVAVPSNVVLPA